MNKVGHWGWRKRKEKNGGTVGLGKFGSFLVFWLDPIQVYSRMVLL